MSQKCEVKKALEEGHLGIKIVSQKCGIEVVEAMEKMLFDSARR
jgi:hypothetical protein